MWPECVWTAYLPFREHILKVLDGDGGEHILLSGQSGAGKTLLAKEFAKKVDNTRYVDCLSLGGYCSDGEGDGNAKVLHDLISGDDGGHRRIIFLDNFHVIGHPQSPSLPIIKHALSAPPTTATKAPLICAIVQEREQIAYDLLTSPGLLSASIVIGIGEVGIRERLVADLLEVGVGRKECDDQSDGVEGDCPLAAPNSVCERIVAGSSSFSLADLQGFWQSLAARTNANAKGNPHLGSKEAACTVFFDLATVDACLAAIQPSITKNMQISNGPGYNQTMDHYPLFPALTQQALTLLSSPQTRGILVTGPAGTGKTQFAQSLLRLLKIPSISVQPSSIRSKYVGQSEKNLSMLFRRARQCAPCVIHIDDIDALFPLHRGGGTVDGQCLQMHENRLITCFLTELDGLESGAGDGVCVLATCRHASSLDRAILRAGRIGHHLSIPHTLPPETLKSLLQHKARTVEAMSPLLRADDGGDLETLLGLLDGCNIAFVDLLFRECALGLLRRSVDCKWMHCKDLIEQYQKIKFMHK